MRGGPIFRFIVGLDQALNPIIFRGSEDVTLSAQCAYRELVHHKGNRFRRFIDWLFLTAFDQDQHCFRSLYGEIDEFPHERELILGILAEHGVERGL